MRLSQLFALLLLVIVIGCSTDLGTGSSESLGNTSTPLNVISTENQNAGTAPADWDLAESEEEFDQVAGYTGDISYALGAPVDFHVRASGPYEIRIYRIGYYGGNGARHIATITHATTPPPVTPCAAGVSCNWATSDTWTNGGSVSGVYLAKLVRNAAPTKGSHVIFVVRDDTRRADVLMQTSDATWQAYNPDGLYEGLVQVTYQRPLKTRTASHVVESFFGGEYQMIRFLEQNGYDVSYTTNVDTARSGSEILEHKLFMSVGHDEYWSKEMRDNVEAARAAGVHLAFFSGNELYWKTRWTDNYSTLVCYKSTSHDKLPDPSGIFTGTWRDARGRTASDPAKPENALTGTFFAVNGTMLRPLDVTYEEGQLRQWRDTPARQLAPCGVVRIADKAIGAEWDEDVDNGFRPPGLFHLSTSSQHRAPLALGPGSSSAGYVENEESGQSTHHMTLYRHASGALVFGAGSEQMPWALDNHQGKRATVGTPSVGMRQFAVNLLADMGIQPTSLASPLVTASASTDVTPPSTTISAPAASSLHPLASAVTIAGTASDVGGRVAAIEVSTDGGITWHPAEGRANWRYTWHTTATGANTVQARAVDDSGNIGTASSVTVQVGCNGPCSIWGSSTPASTTTSDPTSVMLGTKVRLDANGSISAIRFRRVAGDLGAHTAYLWKGGVLLGTASFAGTTPGWNTATFGAPITVDANADYIAAISSQSGFQYATSFYPSGVAYSPPLRALTGVYAYGPAGTLPATTSTYHYFVDVDFTPATTAERNLFVGNPTPAGFAATANNELGVRFQSARDGYVKGIRFYRHPQNTAQQTVNLWGPAPPGSTPVSSTTPGQGLLLASGTYQGSSTGWVSVRLAAPVPIQAGREYVASYFSASGYAYTQNYFSAGAIGDPPLAALGGVYRDDGKTGYPSQTYLASSYFVDVEFSPTGPQDRAFWSPELVPVAGQGAADPVNLGLQFTPDTNGVIAGVRFFKTPSDTGTHSGSLWTSGGSLLAQGTFTETACGWQTLLFNAPVAVNPLGAYVASYHTSTGYLYSVDYFTAKNFSPPSPDVLLLGGSKGVWTGATRAIVDAEQPFGSTLRNSVYTYGAIGFPQYTYMASNYWIDVIFRSSSN